MVLRVRLEKKDLREIRDPSVKKAPLVHLV